MVKQADGQEMELSGMVALLKYRKDEDNADILCAHPSEVH